MKGLWGRQTGSRGIGSSPSWEGGKQKVEVSKLKYSEKQDKQKACKVPGEIAIQCALIISILGTRAAGSPSFTASALQSASVHPGEPEGTVK